MLLKLSNLNSNLGPGGYRSGASGGLTSIWYWMVCKRFLLEDRVVDHLQTLGMSHTGQNTHWKWMLVKSVNMSERLKITSGKAILAKCFFVACNLFVGLETMTQGRWNGRKTIQIWVEIVTATKIKANTMIKYWEQHDSYPPPNAGIYNVLLFRNSLVLEALLQTVKSCINSIPPPSHTSAKRV